MTETRFTGRPAAGRALAERLGAWAGRSDVIVLALPRGGVPVAHEVARALGAPLDVFLVRKLGVPGHEELAMGALASGGEPVLHEETVRAMRVGPDAVEEVIARERAELVRRERLYRAERPASEVRARTVILVDDGLATGATMQAAALAVRAQEPARIIVAVPTASREAVAMVGAVADDVIAVMTPEPFLSVGSWYANFEQTTDAEVRRLLTS